MTARVEEGHVGTVPVCWVFDALGFLADFCTDFDEEKETPAVRSRPPVCLFLLFGNILFQKLTCRLCPPCGWLEEMQRNKRPEAEGSSSLSLSPKEEDACDAGPVRG